MLILPCFQNSPKHLTPLDLNEAYFDHFRSISVNFFQFRSIYVIFYQFQSIGRFLLIFFCIFLPFRINSSHHCQFLFMAQLGSLRHASSIFCLKRRIRIFLKTLKIRVVYKKKSRCEHTNIFFLSTYLLSG